MIRSNNKRLPPIQDALRSKRGASPATGEIILKIFASKVQPDSLI